MTSNPQPTNPTTQPGEAAASNGHRPGLDLADCEFQPAGHPDWYYDLFSHLEAGSNPFDWDWSSEHECLDPSEWKEGFFKSLEQKYHPTGGKTAHGLAQCFEELGLSVRFNVRAQMAEWCWPRLEQYHVLTEVIDKVKASDDGEYYMTAGECARAWSRGGEKFWHPVSERFAASLKELIARCFTILTPAGDKKPLAFRRETWKDSMNALLYSREVDPFKEWLDSLPPWDGVERLDGWLGEVFDVADESRGLAAWASRFLFLGVVWRTYRPGVKLDEMPILIGKGGIGKSTALRRVLPPHFEHLFSDALNFAADPKPESTEGGRRGSVLKWPEGAPVNLG